LALVGDLGSGKTTFIQGLAKGLRIGQKIISPTFILMRKYEVKFYKNPKIKNLYHLDLYRLEGEVESELKNLGIEEVWSDTKDVTVVEWADKARDFLPGKAIWIKFENINENERKISSETLY